MGSCSDGSLRLHHRFADGGARNPNLEAQAKILATDIPTWDKEHKTNDYYYWYYGTLAMYQLQGDHWKRWNDALTRQLLTAQSAAGDNAGSWDPKAPWGTYGGRVFSTALSTLCLEVYYRFLPLYQIQKGTSDLNSE